MDLVRCIRCDQDRPAEEFKATGFGRKKTCDPCVIAKRAATNAARSAEARAAAEAARWRQMPPEPGHTEQPIRVRLPDGWCRP